MTDREIIHRETVRAIGVMTDQGLSRELIEEAIPHIVRAIAVWLYRDGASVH